MNHPLVSWIRSHIFGITVALLIAVITSIIITENDDVPPALYASQDTVLKVTEGKTLLTRDQTRILKAGESASLLVGDKIKTFPRSRATIFWADGSVTRLDEKTSITIESLKVSGDLSSVQIRFETESGKTWSNVIRSLLPDSFFEQSYDHGTYVATVRGTVFEVNLDAGYAQAVHHGIGIKNTKTNTSVEVAQGTAVDARNWKQIGKELLDTAWAKWNEDEDVQYMDTQMKKLSGAIFEYSQQNEWVKSWTKKIRSLVKKEETVDSLVSAAILEKNTDKLEALRTSVNAAKTPQQKAIVHARLLAYHQATNLLPENPATLSLRQTLRDLIIETAPAEKQAQLKETFTQVTYNDYIDAAKGGSLAEAEKLKSKLETAVKDGVSFPGLEDYQARANALIGSERVNTAIEGVKKEGSKMIDAASNAVDTEAVQWLKKDAQGLFDTLKDAASK